MKIEPDTIQNQKLEIKMDLNGKEAHLIKILRKYDFGEVTIYKQNGILVRVESMESIKLDDIEGLGLDIPSKKIHN